MRRPSAQSRRRTMARRGAYPHRTVFDALELLAVGRVQETNISNISIEAIYMDCFLWFSWTDHNLNLVW